MLKIGENIITLSTTLDELVGSTMHAVLRIADMSFFNESLKFVNLQQYVDARNDDVEMFREYAQQFYDWSLNNAAVGFTIMSEHTHTDYITPKSSAIGILMTTNEVVQDSFTSFLKEKKGKIVRHINRTVPLVCGYPHKTYVAAWDVDNNIVGVMYISDRLGVVGNSHYMEVTTVIL